MSILTREEFGFVTYWPLGGRFNIGGECQRRRVEKYGISKYFCKESAAIKYIIKDYKAYQKEIQNNK